MLGLSLAASNNRGGLNYFLPLKTVGGGQPMAATVAPLSCQKPRLLPASAPLSLEHSFQLEGCFRAPEICLNSSYHVLNPRKKLEEGRRST